MFGVSGNSVDCHPQPTPAAHLGLTFVANSGSLYHANVQVLDRDVFVVRGRTQLVHGKKVACCGITPRSALLKTELQVGNALAGRASFRARDTATNVTRQRT